MFKTSVTEIFKIKYPIIVGTMMHLAQAEMVSAVSNSGALGVLSSAMFPSADLFRRELKKVKDLTDRTFAVNINMFPARTPVDSRQYLDIAAEEGVKIIETSGNRAPEDLARIIKSNDMLLVHKCTGVRYAKKAERIGADAVTVVGYENGGATGVLDVTTLCLVPRVVDAVKIPVIGGGGVSDGRGMLAILALGAQAVIMGTAFLISEECPLHRTVKEALIQATEQDTIVIMRSIKNTHRVLANDAASVIIHMEERGAGLQDIIAIASGDKARKMYREGDINAGVISCGQGIGLSNKIRPVKEIIEEIICGADELRKRIAVM